MKKVEVNVNVDCKTIFEGLGIAIETEGAVEKGMNDKSANVVRNIVENMSNPESKVTRLEVAKEIADNFSQEELVLVAMTYFEDVAHSVVQESIQEFIKKGMESIEKEGTEEAVVVTE